MRPHHWSVLFALPAGLLATSAFAAEQSVSDAVKSCIAQEIAGINAHDAEKATACEARAPIHAIHNWQAGAER